MVRQIRLGCLMSGVAGLSFALEIVCQDQPLEMKLESTPDFSHSETRAARGPFFGMRFGRIFSLALLSSSSVAAFRGPNSDSRNGVCFAASRQAREIIAPEALHSHAVFLNIRPDSSSEGERCMKDTDHPIVHSSRSPSDFRKSPTAEEVAHGTTINLGADKTPDWAGATPLLCTFPCPK